MLCVYKISVLYHGGANCILQMLCTTLPCSINAEQRRIKGLGKISAALTPIQEKYDGHIPKPVISDAMKKLGLEEGTKEWLSTQGQYHCQVCTLVCTYMCTYQRVGRLSM